MLQPRDLSRLSAAAIIVTAALTNGCGSPTASVTATSSPSANIATSTDSSADAIPPSPPKATLKPGARTVVLDRAGDKPYDKTFDDLRFDMTVGDEFKREMLPDSIEAMKDKRLRIRGFILPTAQARGIKVFVLVRDNQVCCFGPGAALYDCILVDMQKDKTAEFTIRPVTVEGTFDIREVRGPDGKHLAIYHLVAESIEYR